MKRIFKNDQERSDWLFELASLLKDGYPLSESLLLLGTYYDGVHKTWCESVYAAMQEGEEFSDQLTSANFPNDIISCICIYEKYGDLNAGLLNGAGLLKKKYDKV